MPISSCCRWMFSDQKSGDSAPAIGLAKAGDQSDGKCRWTIFHSEDDDHARKRRAILTFAESESAFYEPYFLYEWKNKIVKPFGVGSRWKQENCEISFTSTFQKRSDSLVVWRIAKDSSSFPGSKERRRTVVL